MGNRLYWRRLRLRIVIFLSILSLSTVLVVRQVYAVYNADSAPEYVYPMYSSAGNRTASIGSYSTSYDKAVPLIWVGGVPRSGTTLMRVMLDAHPDIRCGEETRVIPRILEMHRSMVQSPVEMQRLREAKVSEEILYDAVAKYILSIIVQHGDMAPRLCNKDPLALRSMHKLLAMFPKSKFLLMARDGRAVSHSIVSRKVTIKGFDIQSYRGSLKDWNRVMSNMYNDCLAVGQARCLLVYYEQLVLHPRNTMRNILDFLDIPWNEAVLHHSELIIHGDISLSKKELSTDQVNQPVNTGALTVWAQYIPDDVRRDIRSLAPMLMTLGYDPDAYPPNYGEPDANVVRQSLSIAQMSSSSTAANRTERQRTIDGLGS